MKELKEIFLRSYSNLPEALRKQIIVVVDKKPYTWDSAYFEIQNNTELSQKILNTMKETGII